MQVDDSTRPAKPGEVERATIAIGQFDGDVINKMSDEAGFGESGTGAEFDGKAWSLRNGARPFDIYEAESDGSNLRQVQTKQDVFGS